MPLVSYELKSLFWVDSTMELVIDSYLDVPVRGVYWDRADPGRCFTFHVQTAQAPNEYLLVSDDGKERAWLTKDLSRACFFCKQSRTWQPAEVIRRDQGEELS